VVSWGITECCIIDTNRGNTSRETRRSATAGDTQVTHSTVLVFGMNKYNKTKRPQSGFVRPFDEHHAVISERGVT